MSTKAPDYTLLDHTADLGIKVRGTDLKDLFESTARALMHLMVRGETPSKTAPMKIFVSGEDLADLMVRWLGEVLYLFEGENLVVTSIHIDSLSSSHLDAKLETVPFDPTTHEILSEIKAVTYHQIEVAEKGNRWEAKVIFDM
ncbi:MAG: archease [Deltaproteobacteria bacterium]|nr:MAG: archease [Deltaproteobacteria bacterium]